MARRWKGGVIAGKCLMDLLTKIEYADLEIIYRDSKGHQTNETITLGIQYLTMQTSQVLMIFSFHICAGWHEKTQYLMLMHRGSRWTSDVRRFFLSPPQ